MGMGIPEKRFQLQKTPISESLARIAGSGEIVSLNDDTVSYIGLSFKKVR
jgi:hypothetical protein